MNINMPTQIFELGQCVATPAALAALEENHTPPDVYLTRHSNGDCGKLVPEDVQVNERSVRCGSSIQSVYDLADGRTIWIITDGVGLSNHREHTTVLLPSEY